MNISNTLRNYYVFPCALFLQPPETDGYVTYDLDTECAASTASSTATYVQSGRQDQIVDNSSNLGTISNQYQANVAKDKEWRIDGATFGVQFWVTPLFLGQMAPIRIDLKIPDQLEWPADLRSPFGARESVHMSDHRVAKLGISHHLAKSLEHWASRTPDFEGKFLGLPFGSSIEVPKITADISLMEFRLVANEQLQDEMLSIKTLQQMWGFESAMMPPAIPVEGLLLIRQIQKSISLVKIAGAPTEKLLIFKSRTQALCGLYHELKVLLTIPPHPNIIKKPPYLITTFSKSHEEHRVCGFLLEYYEHGALQEAIPQRCQSKSLNLCNQTRWAKEITMALIHVRSTGHFYSDLKMDNILLTGFNGTKETAVLTDFEQNRNLYNWAPPEIYYVEWIAELGNAKVARSSIDPEIRERYAVIFNRYLRSKGQSSLRTPSAVYDNPDHGWYFPWILSTREEQEAGEVYCLGKVIWCIFEGVGDADNVLGRSIPIESEQRFPEFRRTPEALRGLIKSCTASAREWKDGPISIFRHGGTVFPLGKTGRNGEPKGTFEETKEAIQKFWSGEVAKAEAFMEAKEKYDHGQANKEQRARLEYLDRPKLKEVLNQLDEYATSLFA